MENSDTAEAPAAGNDPKSGLRAVVALRAHTDALELREVEAALRAGLSWTEIAEALGVTRQAVHKKYHRRVDPTIPIPRRNP